MAQHDQFGREIPDPTPVSVPANWQRPLSLHEEIKRFVRVEMSRQAADQGEETFEEADDFDVDDDEVDPASPYEFREMPEDGPGGVKAVDPDPPATPLQAPAVQGPSGAPSKPEGPSGSQPSPNPAGVVP